MYYKRNISFTDYLDSEVERNVAYWDAPASAALELSLHSSPCLKEALFLQAIVQSEQSVWDLVQNMRSLDTDHQAERDNMANFWQDLFCTLVANEPYERIHSELKAPDGDHMLKLGFPVRFAKYADNWHFICHCDTDLLLYDHQSVEYMLARLHESVEEKVCQGKYAPEQYYITIIGSATILYAGIETRPPTVDIDIFDSNLPEPTRQDFDKYGMNMRSHVITFGLPYNYEDRLVVLHQTDHMTTYRAAWEDIIFGKLQRWERNDASDVYAIIDNDLVDWEMLDYVITDKDEACGSGITRHLYHELLIHYNTLREHVGRKELSNEYIFELLNNAC